MARATPLKQSDLTRYAKALRAAGFEAFRVDVKPDGTVSIIAGAADRIADTVNDWD